MAIMLILTLTISAFDPEVQDSNSPFQVAGDYSAVFPLLVVSVFLSLMASRDTVFYGAQRSRGDITAVPEVLCRPGMEGSPLVVGYDQGSYEFSHDDSFSDSDGQESDIERAASASSRRDHGARAVDVAITQSDIEKAFAEAASRNTGAEIKPMAEDDPRVLSKNSNEIFQAAVSGEQEIGLSSSRLDELLGISTEAEGEAIPLLPSHRRTQSAPFGAQIVPSRSRSTSKDWGASANATALPVVINLERANSCSSPRGVLVRVPSFGNIQDHQPSLMEQARMRSASSVADSRHRRVPSLPDGKGRHGRVASLTSSSGSTSRAHRRIPSLGRHAAKNSDASQIMLDMAAQSGSEPCGALSLDDIEQSFSALVCEKVMGNDAFSTKSPWSTNL
jgi:hypothetical protein